MKIFDRSAVKAAIKNSVIRIYETQNDKLNLYRNTLDCFSASIDALVQGISMDAWMLQEQVRQIQKTKQNAIGSIHEQIMGSIEGVENLPVGHVIDIVSHRLRLIAEIKNKHNTTKGNHKVQIYRDLEKKLKQLPQGYIGYYVEVLPKGKKTYNEPFTPSDNQNGTRLPVRNDIRIIDGKSFYSLLTGNDGAIEELYMELPHIVVEIISEVFGIILNADLVTNSSIFWDNFDIVYGKY
ncbi:Eco47II family restriction endonuclease [Candidatus Regiella endosymbiont of Tuberolachnus salignus]|uniref:Eco47II family restriction endonuclease n=1 Tax=Candidatus Regiella endosymbiont of Tuberolachnus salignus TaxID=3077956 RepID=UPI0030CAB259